MDACLQLLAQASQRPVWRWPSTTLRHWLQRLYIHADVPQASLEAAVHAEIADLRRRANADLLPWLAEGNTAAREAEVLLRVALDSNSFPREQFEQLARENASSPDFAATLTKWCARHRELERRLHWLIDPELTRRELANLNPKADAQQIWCFVKYDFRPEFMHAAWANAIKRIAQDPPASTLIRATKKAEQRPLLRTENTLYYHYFVMNWGLDSFHGRTAIAGLRALHAPFHIPDDAMKFVALDAAFTVLDSLSLIGHRALTQTERLGYFHASVELAQAMGVPGLSHDIEEMYEWFRAYNRERSGYAAHKREMWDSISDSFDQSVGIPWPIAKGRRSLEVIAMDEDLRSALGFRPPPRFAKGLARTLAKAVARVRHWLPQEPYVESLQPGLSYPNGLSVTELVQQPAQELATRRCPFSGQQLPPPLPAENQPPAKTAPVLLTWDEVSRHTNASDLWVVIGGDVYDLSAFAKSHPGGLKVLTAGAGRDMTEPFEHAGHSPETRIFMRNFRVGRLSPNEARRDSDVRGLPPQAGETPARASTAVGVG